MEQILAHLERKGPRSLGLTRRPPENMYPAFGAFARAILTLATIRAAFESPKMVPPHSELSRSRWKAVLGQVGLRQTADCVRFIDFQLVSCFTSHVFILFLFYRIIIGSGSSNSMIKAQLAKMKSMTLGSHKRAAFRYHGPFFFWAKNAFYVSLLLKKLIYQSPNHAR